MVLRDLKSGVLPKDFAARVGELGPEVEGLIRRMMCGEEKKRLSCGEVRAAVESILGR